MRFGRLRVFNDDTLSPSATWPLHPHREIEVVTYYAGGRFRYADERGVGGVLEAGWVQHTTVGRGMWHAEINDLPDQPIRFIQMWFLPWQAGLPPALQQMAVQPAQRQGRFLPLVSNEHDGVLPIASAARVYACRLAAGQAAHQALAAGWGGYLYLLEGGPVLVNDQHLPGLGATQAMDEPALEVQGSCF